MRVPFFMGHPVDNINSICSIVEKSKKHNKSNDAGVEQFKITLVYLEKIFCRKLWI